jgi:hypothetical protein
MMDPMTGMLGIAGGGGAGMGGAPDQSRTSVPRQLRMQLFERCQKGDQAACERLRALPQDMEGNIQRQEPRGFGRSFGGGMGSSSSGGNYGARREGVTGKERLARKWGRRTTAPTAVGATGGNPFA